MRKYLLASLALLSALALSGCAPEAPKYPIQGVGAVAVAGDSISVATATCGYTTNCNENSWATGTNPDVKSIADRIRAEEGDGALAYTDATAGAKMADLGPQIDLAESQTVDYVAILAGANDYCAPSLQAMTSPTQYELAINAVMTQLTTRLPKAHISINSVPNPAYLYAANSKNLRAQQVWAYGNICQSMLANPTDQSASAKDRRQAVVSRAEAYNAALARACAKYPQCHYDNGAVFAKKFGAGEINTLDYFHPSIKGQAALAETAWTTGGIHDWLRVVTNNY